MNAPISPQEADQLIDAHFPILASEPCPVSKAAGRVLRENLCASRAQPPFDRIMMDGIAIHHAAWSEGRRAFLMESTCQPGESPHVLKNPKEHCIEVTTGAALPEGCDCVIPYEETDVSKRTATIHEDASPVPMQYVHRMGSDYQRGNVLLERGTRINSHHAAVAAAAGKATILVSHRPSVAVISTGNELVDLGRDVTPYQIRPLNNYSLVTALRNAGFPKVRAYKVPDSRQKMLACLKGVLRRFDVVILSGGVSMGTYDFVPSVLEELGVQPVFHKVRQRPGKPLWFGLSHDRQPVFGLPGNPVSALVCFHRYVLPHIEHAMLQLPQEPEYVELMEAIEFRPELTYFPPVKLLCTKQGRLKAMPLTYHNSGHYAALVDSDGFLELDEKAHNFRAGSTVRFHRWRY